MAAVRVLAACWLGVAGAFAGEPTRGFPTPEAAVEALVDAVRRLDRDAIRELFGLKGDALVAADRVQVTNELAAFSVAYDERRRILREGDDRCVLEVGANGWPFPVPIVRREAGWIFDAEAGQEELFDRRIGRNELAVLEVIRAYVDAQREYASRDRDGDRVLEFAQRLASTAGARDGLYWMDPTEDEPSPLGPLVAQAQAAGYRMRRPASVAEPFHGYFFRILVGQGRHAPGGRHGYVINGNMIAGFALVAWPAQYGESGIMTFLVNQEGRIHQRDLGPRTGRLAASMKDYNPDGDWTVTGD